MDILASYQNRAFAPLDEIAVLLGLPGKMGMSGSKVWQQHQHGEIKAIRDYCETDALNTYLIYLHWQRMKGVLSASQFDEETKMVESALLGAEPHLQEFLATWRSQVTLVYFFKLLHCS